MWSLPAADLRILLALRGHGVIRLAHASASSCFDKLSTNG
jgi:hypothetical protein